MEFVDLTIIIVNFNTRDLTLGCIDSIRKSRSKVNYEIIVVDNASREPIKIKDVKIISFKELNKSLIPDN